jgi:hypothetical protein
LLQGPLWPAPAPMLHAAATVATYGRRRCYSKSPPLLQGPLWWRRCYVRSPPLLQGLSRWRRRYMRPSPLLHTSGAVATRATVAAPMLHAAAAVATRATAVVPMLHAAATAIYAGNHGESYGRRQLGGLALLRTSAMLLSNANGGGAAVRCVVLVSRRRASRVAGDATRQPASICLRQGWWCRRRGCGVVLWA